MVKCLSFIALAGMVTTLSGCASLSTPSPTQDNFYNNFTYYNDGIKPRAVSTSASASFYPAVVIK